MNRNIGILRNRQLPLDLSQVRMDICNDCVYLDYDRKENICLIMQDIFKGFGKNNKCNEKIAKETQNGR
jgi:hypothetical protein